MNAAFGDTPSGELPSPLDDGHAAEHSAHANRPLWSYVFSTDHKIIGLQFLFSSLIWFLLGGLLALAIRWQ